MDDLFASPANSKGIAGSQGSNGHAAPLAERLRPKSLEEVIGQEHITGPDSPLGRMIRAGRLQSLIMWGGPGSGKTSIARLLADLTGLRFKAITAVTTNVAELKRIFAEAKVHAENGSGTCLFIDEIHRMSKATQDQLLEPVESGCVTLVACTTEHIAYELNDAILSRCTTLRLNALASGSLEKILQRAEKLLQAELPLVPEARQAIIDQANGDARKLINQVEAILNAGPNRPLEPADLTAILGEAHWRSDKDRDFHYDRISAFQKSIRGSDPDGALYWFAQMLAAGEDMKFILRRLTVMASEEVAMADPQALVQCIAADQAFARLGSPQGDYAVAQAIVYLATAPKSNAVYKAYHAARALVKQTGDIYPPDRIINHPTPALAKARGYQYDHDFPGAFSGQDFWPDSVSPRTLYEPSPRGFEAQIAKRLDHWRSQRHLRTEG